MMSLLFNILSRFVITFLPRSKCLLISWLQSLSTQILELKKIKSVTVSTVSPSICHGVMGPDAMIFVFWMLSFKPAFSLSSKTFTMAPWQYGVQLWMLWDHCPPSPTLKVSYPRIHWSIDYMELPVSFFLVSGGLLSSVGTFHSLCLPMHNNNYTMRKTWKGKKLYKTF